VKLPKIQGSKDVAINEILQNCEEPWLEKKKKKTTQCATH
jgi:hypothetical protein